MPCRCDYMEPTTKERQLQKTNQLLVFALTAMDRPVTDDIKRAADNMYGGREESVVELCALIRSMSEDDLNRVVYDGRNPASRELANWWDLHQEADRLREQQKTEQELQDAVKKRALDKLTKEERVALGVENGYH